MVSLIQGRANKKKKKWILLTSIVLLCVLIGGVIYAKVVIGSEKDTDNGKDDRDELGSEVYVNTQFFSNPEDEIEVGGIYLIIASKNNVTERGDYKCLETVFAVTQHAYLEDE